VFVAQVYRSAQPNSLRSRNSIAAIRRQQQRQEQGHAFAWQKRAPVFSIN
jgi:hypothetical protein